MITNKDLQKAFYCGHKLDNVLRKSFGGNKYDAVSYNHEDHLELLTLAKDAVYHIKWMYKQLSNSLKEDSLPIDSFYGQY